MEENEDPIEQPIDGVLDLHTFRPKEVRSLLDEYLPLCQERGIMEVRIIHGKGTGALREMVHAHLRKMSIVKSFQLAPANAGGWGATIAHLR